MITLIGTIVGAVCGGKLADMFDRKKMRFAIGIIYVLGAVGTARTSDHTIFMFSRFLGGVGVCSHLHGRSSAPGATRTSGRAPGRRTSCA